MSKSVASAAALLALCASTSHAAGSVEAGEQKAVTCAACHGADGNSVNPEWPSLAGQHAGYIEAQLRAFKSGERENILMSSQAMGLSEEDMQDLAAYFEAQTPARRTADPTHVSLGERVYRSGDTGRQVSACIACHGPAGQGNPGSDYPKISGQHATYLGAQLRAYAAGERRSDMNRMMRDIAAELSEQEIEAVSSYIQGLR